MSGGYSISLLRLGFRQTHDIPVAVWIINIPAIVFVSRYYLPNRD